MNARVLVILFVMLSTATLFAPPPMITGDVPTADKGRFELYTGLRYQESESGEPGRQLA